MLSTRLKLTWSLALLAVPLGAQTGRDHQEAPIAWTSNAPVLPDRPAQDQPARNISAELLHYPLSGKALRMLQKALQTSDVGDHLGAVRQLRKTLDKFPDTGAYVYSLLGVEYLKTDQIPAAIDVLKQAVELLPHDASNHANLGLAFACREAIRSRRSRNCGGLWNWIRRTRQPAGCSAGFATAETARK